MVMAIEKDRFVRLNTEIFERFLVNSMFFYTKAKIPFDDWDSFRYKLSIFFKEWPLRLAVRTSPFHGENTGSIPVGITKTSSVKVQNNPRNIDKSTKMVRILP